MVIIKDKSFRLSLIITFIFLVTGFSFLHFGLSEYNWAVFVLLPIVLGIAIGALPDKRWAILGGILMLLIFLILLIVGELEGFLCVLMALPIIITFIFLGTIIIHLIKKYQKLKSSDQLHILLSPLLIFVFAALLGTPGKIRNTSRAH